MSLLFLSGDVLVGKLMFSIMLCSETQKVSDVNYYSMSQVKEPGDGIVARIVGCAIARSPVGEMAI